MLNYFPKYFSNKAIILYFAALMVVSILFISNILPFIWLIFGIVEVVGFFYFSNVLIRKWGNYSPRLFTKKIFITALVLRVVWVFVSYVLYTSMTGQAFEFSAGDAPGYHGLAAWLYKSGDLFEIWNKLYKSQIEGGVSDTGYPMYLIFLYRIFGDGLIIPRLIKALLGSYMCVLIYRLATRNFGEEVGRMSAIFCMLMPNLILYAGLHVKEVEMLFLTVLFVERSDFLIRSHIFKFWSIFPVLLLASSLFFFRTVLGATAVFSLLTAILLSEKQVINTRRRLVLTLWVGMAGLYLVGGKIASEVESVWQDSGQNQDQFLEWTATREGGNKFATQASKAIFAPIIFIIPFPTMINSPGQENQQLIHGGNFVKNIMAFFVIYSVFLLFIKNQWRENILLLTFTLGYLIIIAMSAFAQSERFHQPALPFLMIFAAVGISKITNKEKLYFIWYLAFIFVAILGWSWFKLAGRGII